MQVPFTKREPLSPSFYVPFEGKADDILDGLVFISRLLKRSRSSRLIWNRATTISTTFNSKSPSVRSSRFRSRRGDRILIFQTVSDCDSEWVTKYYGSFVCGWKLWIGEFELEAPCFVSRSHGLLLSLVPSCILTVMEYLAGGSCLDLVGHSFAL